MATETEAPERIWIQLDEQEKGWRDFDFNGPDSPTYEYVRADHVPDSEVEKLKEALETVREWFSDAGTSIPPECRRSAETVVKLLNEVCEER